MSDLQMSHDSVKGMSKDDIQRKMKMLQRPAMSTIDVSPAGSEKFCFISQDLPRTLVIPKSTQKQMKGIINEEKLDQLKKAAAFKISEEEAAMKAKKTQEKDRLLKEQEKRRLEFEAWDLVRKKNEKLSELEEEAKQKMEYLREKANEAIKEQNEEIKEINQLILSAKVQAIRDSQIEEKKIIKKEFALAEESLDSVMEEERIKGVLKDREITDKRKEAAHKAASKLQEQIKSNIENKILDEEHKVKERELLLKKMQEDHQRDYQNMKMQQLKKQTFKEELIKDNEEVARRRQAMKKQSEREDRIIAEFQKLKAMQEEAKKAADKEAKHQKELELSKMAELYDRASGLQSEQDALRARRAQEEKERQYRMKEKQDTLKKKEMLDDLKESRAKQLEYQERLREDKARAEYEQLGILLKKLEGETRAEKRKELFKKLENLKHLDELKSQIRKKEMEKINEKKAFFSEGIHLHQEAKRQAEMLEILKKEKLYELRKYKILETYINHIKRKVNLEE